MQRPSHGPRRLGAGALLVAAVGLYQALLAATLPFLPTNDGIGYFEMGHAARAQRPVDPYAPPPRVPATASLPSVDAWRANQHPAYGYPWIYLDLPVGWQADPEWALGQQRAPLVRDPTLEPSSHEWDLFFPPGTALWLDVVQRLFPPRARSAGFVVLNHALVLLASVLVWRIGIQLGAPRVGFIAALLYGLWLVPGARAQEMVGEPLFIALDVGACWMLLRGLQRPAARAGPDRDSAVPGAGRWLMGSGVLLGAAFAVRSVAAPQALVALAATWWTGDRRSGQRLRRAAAFALALAGVLLLLLAHNGLSYGRWTYSTGFGRHLFNRVATVERWLDANNPAAARVLDLSARPRCEGMDAHPLQAGPLDLWTDSSCWPLYFMLRWQGRSVVEADGILRSAAMATIQDRPLAYVLGSLRGWYALARKPARPPTDILREPGRWRAELAQWLEPQRRLAPYPWVASQWRIVKEDMPPHGHPTVLPPFVRRVLLALAGAVPRVDGGRCLLTLVAVGLALGARGARRVGWPVAAGWFAGVLLLPAWVQSPNPRYADPGLPLQVMLVVFAIGWIGERFTRLR